MKLVKIDMEKAIDRFQNDAKFNALTKNIASSLMVFDLEDLITAIAVALEIVERIKTFDPVRN